MNKKVIWVMAVLILVSGAGIYFLNEGTLKKISDKSLEFVGEKINGRVNTSGPLRKENDDESSFLSIKGVINETNKHRRELGQSELKESALLNVAAQKKVNDMFSRQYFEHEAPTGEGAGDLVMDAGYKFIVVGENLALGNYKDDKTLVEAWMDSPGHRENILKNSYSEIGVAVSRGLFEGKETWLAVQHFAKPLSDCPEVSGSVKEQIDSNNLQLEQMKTELEEKKKGFVTKPVSREEGEEYNNKVEEHNSLVNKYNELLGVTKELISLYNSQIQNFNACARE